MTEPKDKLREIKFRAWDKENEEMLFGGDFSLYAKQEGTIEGAYFDEDGGQEVLLMQYTGRKDNDGKEIYHKDRVSAYGYSNWIVEWHNNGWKLKQEDGTNYQEIPEAVIVFGNIHENPELLKEVPQ